MLISWGEEYLYGLVPYGFIGKKQSHTPHLFHFWISTLSPPLEQPLWLYSFSSSFSLISVLYSSWCVSTCLFFCVPPFLTPAPCGAMCRFADFLPKFISFWWWSAGCLTCALFQSIGKLESFSAAATKRSSLLSSLCQGDNLYCSPIQPPSLYFIQGNKYTRVCLIFFHCAAVPLKRSFYVKRFCTNYSSWLLTCLCWNSIWNPDSGIQTAFWFYVNGIPELFYTLSK